MVAQLNPLNYYVVEIKNDNATHVQPPESTAHEIYKYFAILKSFLHK